jgi:hypothetical protein
MLGMRAAFLVLQRQGTQLSRPQKIASTAVVFGVFAVLFVRNL